MGQVAVNDAGEQLFFDAATNSWQPLPTGHAAKNPDTGEILLWNGADHKWEPYHKPDPMKNAMGILQSGIMQGAADIASVPKALVGTAQKMPANWQEEYLRTGVMPKPTAELAFPETVAALPNKQEALAAISEGTGVPIIHGQEASGRILEAAGEGGTAGLPLGIASGVGGALAGAGSQTAAELGGGPVVQMIAGLGLPLLFGGISSTVRGILPSAEKQLGQALQGVTKEELFAAETAMRNAAAQKNPLTWSEALNSVTNGRFPELPQLQRMAEQTSGGGKVLSQVMSKRLDAARGQAESNLDKIGPKLQGQALTDVPENLNVAAKAAMRRELANMRSVTKPAYKAAAADEVPQADMLRIVGKLDQEIAAASSADVKNQLIAFRKELVEQPSKSAAASPMEAMTGVPGRTAQPETYKLDVGRLDSIRKSWRDKIELPDPNINAAAVPKEVGARLGPILSDLRDSMKRNSTAYRVARDYHETTMKNVIEPLQRSPTGQLAEAPAELPVQRQKILPQGEQGVVDPVGVKDTVKRLEAEKPGRAAAWLRTNLQSQFDDILKSMQGAGSDASRGTSLWARVVGNETQRANLKAYVEALPGGDKTWQGFETMLDTLEAQRYRLPANSATAFNAETLKALQGKGIPFDFTDLNPTTLFSGAMKEASAARRLRLNSTKLANTLLDVGARQRLAQLAKLQPNSREARRLVGSILELTTTAQDQQQ